MHDEEHRKEVVVMIHLIDAMRLNVVHLLWESYAWQAESIILSPLIMMPRDILNLKKLRIIAATDIILSFSFGSIYFFFLSFSFMEASNIPIITQHKPPSLICFFYFYHFTFNIICLFHTHTHIGFLSQHYMAYSGTKPLLINSYLIRYKSCLIDKLKMQLFYD